MILEAVILTIRPGQNAPFEEAFAQAQTIISASPGYLSHQLQKCLEIDNQYLLLVQWESVEAHEVGFRQSAAYQEWKKYLHHFYDPFPAVYHYQRLW